MRNITIDIGGIGTLNPFRYRGYYFDTETGLYHLKSRYYDPQTGRFINADDISMLGVNGDFISYNLYSYCLNDPINRADESGTFSWKKALGFASLATLAAVAVGGVIASASTLLVLVLISASIGAGANVVGQGASNLFAEKDCFDDMNLHSIANVLTKPLWEPSFQNIIKNYNNH